MMIARFFLLFFLMISPLKANEFEELPVLHEGRIKPLDTLARLTLKRFSGVETYNKKSATQWLMDSIFESSVALNSRVFKVDSKELQNVLGLEKRSSNLYSHNEIAKNLEKNNIENKDLLALKNNLVSFLQTINKLSSFSALKDKKEFELFKKDLENQSFISKWKISLEVYLNKADLIFWAMIVYALVLLSLLFRRKQAASLLYLSALFLHMSVIIARIILLGRPPVATLYESILFVSLIAALGGGGLYILKKQVETLAVGAFLALTLLLISYKFTGEGDPLTVLVAVLNTRLWLTLHVVCITIGYAASILSGTLAHVALIKDKFYRYLHPSALTALFFTIIGTLLGGIWADQSWGRFWGWDPKENGALLIILWLLWVLHGKMTPCLDRLKFTSLLAVLPSLVVLSWFGVNLLNVGLHSYGFTSGTAAGLFTFCFSEVLLIASLYKNAKKVN